MHAHKCLYIPGLERLLRGFFRHFSTISEDLLPHSCEGTWLYDRVLAFLLLGCFFLLVPVHQSPMGPQALRCCRALLRLEVAPSSVTHIWSDSVRLMPRWSVLILHGDGLT